MRVGWERGSGRLWPAALARACATAVAILGGGVDHRVIGSSMGGDLQITEW